jgi:hypothetical protein
MENPLFEELPAEQFAKNERHILAWAEDTDAYFLMGIHR